MITDINLKHFRSYNDASFDLAPGVNIIVGPNGSGKTNLIEALLVIAKGTSYRATDPELIEFGNNTARLAANTPNGNRIVKIGRSQGPTSKQFQINGQQLHRLSQSKTLPIVLFEPNHLIGLIGSPEARRNFIDDLLEQTDQNYSKIRKAYRRTLAQRNSLLKKPPSQAKSQLFAWNVRLSSLGGQIVDRRRQLVGVINAELSGIYNNIANTKNVAQLVYKTACDLKQYESSLMQRLEASAETDFLRGSTSYGPHREDITIMLGGHLLSEVASRGETRSLLLAMKLIEARLIEEARSSPPLLLLDDVFSELDGARRYALTNFLQKYQAFITTTDADLVIQHFTQTTNIIPLNH